jgi:hypothetical protein
LVMSREVFGVMGVGKDLEGRNYFVALLNGGRSLSSMARTAHTGP